MRILIVTPHYFGHAHPGNNLPTISSYIEPLGRIAAFSEMISALYMHHGPRRHTLEGAPVPGDSGERVIDIVVLAIKGQELLDDLGLAPGTFEVEYVTCEAPWIGMQSQRVMRDRLGQYDFYCYLEDDLIIHDPAFFEKLAWFEASFGPQALLMPVRYEVPAMGTPAKVVVDPVLPESYLEPFRRPGQRETIEAPWHGRPQTFALPPNPHAASHFLSARQMELWVQHPTFDDRVDSWAGPLESAATFSVGRVFDIYKPAAPDPFFLELHHYGTRYAPQAAPPGIRYGESPLLAIAQNAMRALLPDNTAERPEVDESFSRLAARWLAQGTAVESRASLEGAQRLLGERDQQIATLTAQLSQLTQAEAEQTAALRAQASQATEAQSEQTAALTAQLRQLRDAQAAQRKRERSLRWLAGTAASEIARRLGKRR